MIKIKAFVEFILVAHIFYLYLLHFWINRMKVRMQHIRLMGALLLALCVGEVEAQTSPTMTSDSLTVAERIERRGVTNLKNVFIPKGQWITGAAASFSMHDNNNYTFAIIEDIRSEGYNMRISPMIAYAIGNNMAIGVRGVYSRTNQTIDNADLKFGDEETGTEIFVNAFKAVTHTYTVSAIWRQYIPLGSSRRFAIFNEISLGAGGTQSIFAADQPVRGTYERGYTLSLGVSPGLIAFATNDVAIEVNVGVMGINYTDVDQVHNQVEVGSRRTSSMNFKVNLLSIGVGVSFYL